MEQHRPAIDLACHPAQRIVAGLQGLQPLQIRAGQRRGLAAQRAHMPAHPAGIAVRADGGAVAGRPQHFEPGRAFGILGRHRAEAGLGSGVTDGTVADALVGRGPGHAQAQRQCQLLLHQRGIRPAGAGFEHQRGQCVAGVGVGEGLAGCDVGRRLLGQQPGGEEALALRQRGGQGRAGRLQIGLKADEVGVGVEGQQPAAMGEQLLQRDAAVVGPHAGGEVRQGLGQRRAPGDGAALDEAAGQGRRHRLGRGADHEGIAGLHRVRQADLAHAGRAQQPVIGTEMPQHHAGEAAAHGVVRRLLHARIGALRGTPAAAGGERCEGSDGGKKGGVQRHRARHRW
mmetsp:Transcript_6471/g.26662  ORF Transcript_6471/g.26662 Transcript_6471/m.26662 type:complete len:342 (+) Transcript_6471:1534-2559(+)